MKEIVSKVTCANKGAARELIVSANLMLLGYEVYRACGPNGKADLVCRNGNSVLFIEVRQLNIDASGSVRFLIKETDDCDFYAGVLDDGSVVYSPREEQHKGRKYRTGKNKKILAA